MNIRGKSVGEEVEVHHYLDDGVTEIPISIQLDEIQVKEGKGHEKKIKLDDSLMMEMKYPSLDEFIKNNFDIKGDVDIDKSLN